METSVLLAIMEGSLLDGMPPFPVDKHQIIKLKDAGTKHS